MTINWIDQVTGPNGELPFSPAVKGFGVYTRPAQNAAVFHVTNLNPSGPGSLEAAINATGKRVVIFDVAGMIDYGANNFVLSRNDIHIAGQTAPYPGITIKAARNIVNADDVVIEHIRFMSNDEHTNSRLEDSSGYENRDALVIQGDSDIKNIVLNHCTMVFGIDGTLDIVENVDEISVRNCIIGMSLNYSIHDRGAENNWSTLNEHGFTSLIGQKVNRVDITGSVLCYGEDRLPRTGAANFFYINNVNFGTNRGHFVQLYTQGGSGNNTSINANVAGNVFIDNDSSQNIVRISPQSGREITMFFSQNRLYLNGSSTAFSDFVTSEDADTVTRFDNSSLSTQASSPLTSAIPHDQGLPIEPVNEDSVLNLAGTWPAFRLPLEAEITANIKSRQGEVINVYSEVGNLRFDEVLDPDPVNNYHPDEPNTPGAPTSIADRKKLTEKGWPNWASWLLSTSPMARKSHFISSPNTVLPSGYTRLEAYLHACSRYVELGYGSQDESEIDSLGKGWTP